MFAARFLGVNHPADEDACVADDEPSRLEDQPAARFLDAGDDDLREGAGRQRFLLAIMDAETAAHIPTINCMSLFPELVDKNQPFFHCLVVRFYRENR